MSDIEKVLETAEDIGARKENLRISQAFLEAGVPTFTNEQWKIIRQILVSNNQPLNK